MNDFEKTLEAKSDQWNAVDLMGRDIEVKIKSIKVKSSDEQPVTITLENEEKFYRPSKSMRRVMASIWNTTDPSTYIGRSLKLYRDPHIRLSGKEVGGICISHASNISKPIDVTIPISRSKTRTFRVYPLDVTAPNKVEQPKQKLTREELKLKMDEVASDQKKKSEWWDGLDNEQRAIVIELAKGNK